MPSRESELYKDKIEVSLDGRQIFYLFFGGAVIVGLVFVLGVMVGRRVEARGHIDRADPSAVSDPLAALDRLERSDNLSFHGALTGSEAPTDVEKAIGEIEKHRLAGRAARPEPAPAVSPPPAAETHAARPEAPLPPAPHGAAPDAADKPAADTHGEPMPRSDADKPRAEKRDADKRDADKRDADKRDADKRDADKRDDKRDSDKKPRKHDDSGSKDHVDGKKHGEPVTRPEAHADASDRSETRTKYTLQLSSFQDRSEAEALLSSTRSAGFQANLSEAEVNGKTFYRVRLGSYRSIDAANDAKADYEKAAKGKTAQVMVMH